MSFNGASLAWNFSLGCMENDHDDAIIDAMQSKERVEEDFIFICAIGNADLSP